MEKILLYRYTRADGGITVSPIKPDVEYTEMFRLVADEGKVLVKGEITTPNTDVASVEGWEEVEGTDGEATEQDYLNALEELGVNFDE